MFFNETIKCDPLTAVDVTQVTLVNETSKTHFSLSNTTHVVVQNETFVNVTLTEAQRVIAIAMSGTPGGDMNAITITLNPGGFRDMGLNLNFFQQNIYVNEVPDTIAPIVTNATMQFSGGVLVVRATEFIDSTPVSRINLSKIILVDNTGDGNVPMTGANVVSKDDYTIEIDMSESQRVAALRISSATGGDGTQLQLDALPGAFKDVAGNDNVGAYGFLVNEIEDVIRPTIDKVSLLNYSDGKVVISASETIDGTPSAHVDLSLMWLARETTFVVSYNSTSGEHNYSYTGDPNRVSLVGANVTSKDETSVTIHLTVHQRAQLQYWSGTPGGDGSPVVLDALDRALRDMSNLSSIARTNLSVNEIADTVPPTITSVTIDIGTGHLMLQFDEYILASTLNPSLFRVSESTGSVGADTSNFSSSQLLTGDGLEATLKISEGERVNAFYMSEDWDNISAVFVAELAAVKDLGLVNVQFADGIAVHEIPDRFEPLLQSASIDYATGFLTLIFNETVDVTPQNVVNLSRVGVVDTTRDTIGILDGAGVVTNDGTSITIQLTESQRVQAIQTGKKVEMDMDLVTPGIQAVNDGGRFVGPGGDSAANVFDLYQGALKDISMNEATERLNFPLAETPDMTKPTILEIELFFGVGEILFKFDETIDMTPASDFFMASDLFGFFVKGNPGSDFSFILTEAEIADEDALNITFKLTEADRIKILKGSNMPGGRGKPVEFAIVDQAFYDMAHRPFEADVNIPIIEHPDDIPPVLDLLYWTWVYQYSRCRHQNLWT